MTVARYLQTGIVLVRRADTPPSQWCALRAAYVGERIMTTCLAELEYGPVNVQVVRPGERLPHNTCPQCKRHVEIALNGACVPVEGVATGRTTRDLRKPTGGAKILATARAALSAEDQRELCAWAAEDAAYASPEDEWSESGVPEMVLREMTSRSVRT